MKKLLALLLALLMLASAVPVSAQTDGGASVASAPAMATQAAAAKKVTFPDPNGFGRSRLAQHPNGAALVALYDAYVEAMKNPSLTLENCNWVYLETPVSHEDNNSVCSMLSHDYALANMCNLPILTKDESIIAVAASFGEQIATLMAVVEQIIAKVNPAWSDYEKALYLHDYIVAHVNYRMVGYHQSAYGALVDGVAVCAGYADAYQLLLNSVGIPALYVTGTTPAGNHAWNYVKLDGNWYQTDVTWDDPIGGGGRFHYNYFNLTDEQMFYNHTVDDFYDDRFLPVCDSDELAYTKTAVYAVESLNAKTWKNLYQTLCEKSAQGYEYLRVYIERANNKEGDTLATLEEWLNKNLENEKAPDCFWAGGFGSNKTGFYVSIVIDHVYTNNADATCNTCGMKRQLKCHTWVKGTCRLCGLTMPSSITQVNVPTNLQVKKGEKFRLDAQADGVDLTFQWYIKRAGETKYTKYTRWDDGKEWIYWDNMTDYCRDSYVYCIITDKFGNQVKTKTVVLRMAASIISEPATAAYAPMGKKVSVKIKAAGDGLKYTWYYKNAGASKYTKSSASTATYSTTMSDKVKERQVYCVVTDKYGNKVQTKTFILRESVSITTQPKTVTVKKDAIAKASVKASGDGLKYQWYIKNANGTKYSKSSITSATYSVKMSDKAKDRLIYCVVTDQYGNTVKSKTVRLKMK